MRAKKSMVEQREAQRFITKAILPPALSRGRHQHIHSLLIASIQFDLVSSQLQLQQLLIDFRFSVIQFQFSLNSVSIQFQFSFDFRRRSDIDSGRVTALYSTPTTGPRMRLLLLLQLLLFLQLLLLLLILLLLLPPVVYYSYYYC